MDTETLIELATGSSQMNRSRAMHRRSQLDSPSYNQGKNTKDRRIFLDSILDRGREPRTGAYPHPAKKSGNADSKKGALAPSDLAWLDRLPKDPAQVSMADASTLHSLLTSLTLGRASRSDRRLVESYWSPVKALHDKAEAEHDLQLAKRPLPAVTTEAIRAVAESLRHADPDLDPELASIRAGRMLDNAANAKASQQQKRVQLAQQRLDEISNSGPDAA